MCSKYCMRYTFIKEDVLFIWNLNLTGHSGFFVFPKSGNPTYHYAGKTKLERGKEEI